MSASAPCLSEGILEGVGEKTFDIRGCRLMWEKKRLGCLNIHLDPAQTWRSSLKQRLVRVTLDMALPMHLLYTLHTGLLVVVAAAVVAAVVNGRHLSSFRRKGMSRRVTLRRTSLVTPTRCCCSLEEGAIESFRIRQSDAQDRSSRRHWMTGALMQHGAVIRATIFIIV